MLWSRDEWRGRWAELRVRGPRWIRAWLFTSCPLLRVDQICCNRLASGGDTVQHAHRAIHEIHGLGDRGRRNAARAEAILDRFRESLEDIRGRILAFRVLRLEELDVIENLVQPFVTQRVEVP